MAEWCTQADVELVLSVNGLIASTNDDLQQLIADQAIVADAIKRARIKLSQSLGQKYDLSTITSANEWVRQATSVYAAIWILRRNSGVVPPGLQEEYEELQSFAMEIQNGGMAVPGLSQQSTPGIAVANLTIDSRFVRAKIRRVETISFPHERSAFPQFTDRQDIGSS